MNDTEKDLEIKELIDKVHTYKLRADIILISKYIMLGFSILLTIILFSSIFW